MEHQEDPNEDLTNQDVDPIDTWEELRDTQLRQDDEDGAEEARLEAPAPNHDPDDEETVPDCDGYSPDTWCGICASCEEARAASEIG